MRGSNPRGREPAGRHQRRMLAAMLIGIAGGCQSTAPPNELPQVPSATTVTPAAVPPAPPEPQASTQPLASSALEANGPVRQVAFDQPLVTTAIAPELAHATPALAHAASPADVESGEVLTLAALENLALGNNPTLRQLEATVEKAAALRTQVGLRGNPVVGYQAQQLADEGTDQHLAYVEQEFVTGGKLVLNRRVMDRALSAQQWELETQRQRLQTDLRVRFYEALAAQRRIELTEEFAQVTAGGLELTELRRQANEASQIEVLQARIQMNEIDLARQQAQVQLDAARKSLAALAGVSSLPHGALEGELAAGLPSIDWVGTLASMIQDSPERQAAQARVLLASENLRRQEAQPIPNLMVELAAGVDNGTNSEMLNLQVGAPLPVHNANQGNIAAARADYCRAVMEVQRIEQSIQERLADVSRQYDAARAAVLQYETEILPSAAETLRLAEQAYRAGEFGFLQVLVVRRTYFESNLSYLEAQRELAQANARVRGFVLTGGLDSTVDLEMGDDLRGQAFDQR